MSTKQRSTEDAPQEPEKAFDPRQVARDQIAEYVGTHRVDHRRLGLAVARHSAQVAEAGRPVPLDWHTLRVLRSGGAA